MREIKFREIKFRAWDKVCKPNRIKTWEQLLAQYQLTHVFVSDYFILMQYTGLKDKNGKEIYEGDIVSFEDAECDAEGYNDNVFLNRGVVSYDEVSMCYSFSNRQTVEMEDLYIPTDAEIIGNIYENPELLEEVRE